MVSRPPYFRKDQKVKKLWSVPKFVTFTGIDEWTRMQDLFYISERYPVEWGVLLSPSRAGSERYPKLETVLNLLKSRPPFVRLSAHLCGSYSQNFLETGVSFDFLPKFDRIQINTSLNAQAVISNPKIEEYRKRHKKPIIVQSRAMSWPDNLRYHYLFDRSGGKGVSPEKFPVQQEDLGMLVGYAGGIGPENIEKTLENIKAHHFWLDMETNVRTTVGGESFFDPIKVREICNFIWGYQPPSYRQMGWGEELFLSAL